MSSISFDVTFKVRAKTRAGETVCIVGDCPELGDWLPNHGKQMVRQTKTIEASPEDLANESFEDGDVWKKTISLKRLREYKYRYFICRIFAADNEDSERSVLVKWWEGHKSPRIFTPQAEAKEKNLEGADNSGPDVFGELNGNRLINWGWLTDQSQVQIRLHDNPIKMWKPRYRNQTYSIKCTPVDHRYRDHVHDQYEEEVLDDSIPNCSRTDVLVSVLEKGRSKPVPQEGFGAVYHPDNYMSFLADTIDPEYLGFQLDFYVHFKDEPVKHVGSSFILPLNMKETVGVKEIPINGLKYKPIGTVEVGFLLIKPLINYHFTMEKTFQRYWKSSRSALDVGHRGMGKSYKCRKLATVRENTLASLSTAANHGADLVEFDVQLSKDKVPIIYHDFKVLMTYRKRMREDLELFEMPIKDLTLADLQNMKLSHPSCDPSDKYDGIQDDDVDPEEIKPFPTLQQVFETVDKHTGFNIEVKHPMMKVNGTCQQENYFDLNFYVDTILRVVFEHHAGRRIVFSSFDADCCLALRLKQNIYPVLFLTQADSTIYVQYSDYRSRTVVVAAEFAHSAGLLGVDVISDVLLKDMSLIQYIKDYNQVLFVWGDHCNDKETIQKFRDYKVDGIIYDRIDFYKSTGKESIFKIEERKKVALLTRLGSIQPEECNNNSGTDSQ